MALPVTLCACVWGSGGLGTQRGITCDPVCLCMGLWGFGNPAWHYLWPCVPVYGALGVWEPSVALPVTLCACVWGSGGLGTQRGITCVCLCMGLWGFGNPAWHYLWPCVPVYGALGVWEPSVALCACVWGSGGLGTQRGITCDPVCLPVYGALGVWEPSVALPVALCMGLWGFGNPAWHYL